MVVRETMTRMTSAAVLPTHWAQARAAASPGVATSAVVDGDLRALVAWPTGPVAVVLDPFTESIWQLLDGDLTVTDLATDLTDAGFPDHLEPLLTVATAVDALRRAGLATTPTALAPLPADLRRTIPHTATGGDRWIHASVNAVEKPPHDETPAAEASSDPGWSARWVFEGRVVQLLTDHEALRGWALDRAAEHRSDPSEQPTLTITVAPDGPLGHAVTVNGQKRDWATDEDLVSRVAAAVVLGTGALAPGVVADLGPGRVDTPAPIHGEGDSSSSRRRWLAARYLDADGSLVHPRADTLTRWVEDGVTALDAWKIEAIVAVEVPGRHRDRAEDLAEMATAARSADHGRALTVMADLLARVAEPTGTAPNDAPAPRTAVPAELAWADALLDLGDTKAASRSVKVQASRVVPGRWLTMVTPRPDLDPAQIREAVRRLGLPEGERDLIESAIGLGFGFLVGNDGTWPQGRRKLYIDDPSPEWFQTLGDSPVAVNPSSDNGDGEGPFGRGGEPPPGAVGTTPGMVAWKWDDRRAQRAYYWRTDLHRFTEVLPDHPDWSTALHSFPVIDQPGPNLLLVEESGRRSLDLAIDDSPGLDLHPQLRRLAATAQLDSAQRDQLIEAVTDGAVTRVIGGLDGSGHPLATLYLAPPENP